jgi:hypothetical protein
MTKMTKSQEASLARIVELTANGHPLDVTYKVKGVHSESLFCLEEKGLITIERQEVANRNYPNMFATVN